jgi:hypothetical protein
MPALPRRREKADTFVALGRPFFRRQAQEGAQMDKDSGRGDEDLRSQGAVFDLVSVYLGQLEQWGADSTHPDDLRHRIEHIVAETLAFINVLGREIFPERWRALQPSIKEILDLQMAFHDVDNGRRSALFAHSLSKDQGATPTKKEAERMVFDWLTSAVTYYRDAHNLSRSEACKWVAEQLRDKGYRMKSDKLEKIVENDTIRKWAPRHHLLLKSDQEASGLLDAILSFSKQ